MVRRTSEYCTPDTLGGEEAARWGYNCGVETDRPKSPDDERQPLDTLVKRLEDPSFQSEHHRSVGMRETSAHVNPLMLTSTKEDSAYVDAWRDHAARCPACHQLFEYFGLQTD